jgi:outer membrane protein
MKRLFKVAIITVCILVAGNFARAQSKMGYVNFDELVRVMPEYKTAQTANQTYQKQFVDQLTVMNNEYQAKVKEYQAQQATMTDAVRTAKQTELGDMQKRIQDYNTSAQQQVEAKGQELLKPIADKVKAAVTSVAQTKGYNYVYNSASTQFVVAPDADDITAAVKAQLGLK